jgi:hypothetical protein
VDAGNGGSSETTVKGGQESGLFVIILYFLWGKKKVAKERNTF